MLSNLLVTAVVPVALQNAWRLLQHYKTLHVASMPSSRHVQHASRCSEQTQNQTLQLFYNEMSSDGFSTNCDTVGIAQCTEHSMR